MTAAPPAPPASSPPAEPALPRREHSFLAFDYGFKRTGVASGNTVTWSASPLTTVNAEGKARFAPIERLIRDWQPDALIVGVPFHPDGAEHENTLAARRFARQLEGRFHLPVIEVDERYSTTEALAAGARDADAFAAALLLQQFFDSQVQLKARAERDALDAAAAGDKDDDDDFEDEAGDEAEDDFEGEDEEGDDLDDADDADPHDPNHETGPAPAAPR